VVCNGYKDREYIRLALIGRKLGLQTFLVVEKSSELQLIIEESAKLGVKPGLGVRMRLASLGAGKWQNSGGDKAKFGLSPRQVLDLVEKLRGADMLDCLELLHFHMGSQISNVRDIANGMREAVRYFVELEKLGCTIRYMDSGGGLGVDYEGTRSRGFCSVNYGLDQFAYTLVQPLAEACAEHKLPPPMMITEAGRALTAHHAVMVVNVSEVERAPEGSVPPVEPNEPATLRHLRDTYADLESRPPLELFLEAQQALSKASRCTRSASCRCASARAWTTCSTRSRTACATSSPARSAATARCWTSSTSAWSTSTSSTSRCSSRCRTCGRSTRCSRSCRSSAWARSRSGAA
jgi:arginine decarboxylase